MVRYKLNVRVIFPVRYADSKRALAVQGSGADFRRSMVDSYRNLTAHMPENGLQVVMFTHQDASIWADLTLILWAAGLRVTGAWTVGTETPFGVKEGNYVQGTVLMVLRKQTSTETAFLHEVVPDVDASNFLVPPGLPDHLWRRLGPEEKLYLKGLEIEGHGEFRAGVYQEFARGFGVRDYRFLLRTGKANETRLKTASEFRRRDLGDAPFGRSVVRHALYAVWRAAEDGEVAGSLTWLRTELEDYWSRKESLAVVLRHLAAVDIDHWREDAAAARLAGAVENDHV